MNRVAIHRESADLRTTTRWIRPSLMRWGDNRGQIFSILRRIVVLFNEKSGKYGPIIPLSQ